MEEKKARKKESRKNEENERVKTNRKVLFLVTELQKPIGGLHRFVTELLPAWRDRLKNKETELEPMVFSIYDPELGSDDLVESSDFKEFSEKTGIKIMEAKRGGEKCFFIEKKMSDEERNAFHYELWKKYRIKSEKASNWGFYRKLNAFWKAMPEIAEYLVSKGVHVELIDCQDWLAFPAGFLCKEKIKRPLLCRFHSGEFGRSVGNPDPNDAPLTIEVAALQEADYIAGVSVSEAKFEIENLLPLKKKLFQEISQQKDAEWVVEQKWKEKQYSDFLFLEPEEDLIFIKTNVGGIPNGIMLGEWKKITKEDIREGREFLEKILPGKLKYVVYAGRIDSRKGVDVLLEVFCQKYKNDGKAGLIIISRFEEETLRKYSERAKELGSEKSVYLYNTWVEESLKKKLFCASDVMVFPSLYEPFGLVTLEAMAADLACYQNNLLGPIVVVGDTGGMHEVIRNGANGYKIPIKDFKIDFQRFQEILDEAISNESVREEITKKAAKRVESVYFNWSQIVSLVFEMYKKAVRNFEYWNIVRKMKNSKEGESMETVEEYFGKSAGKVWNCLKENGPLDINQLRHKAGLGEHELYGALGWLAKENKIKAIEEKPWVYKFALNE